jgi:hypothetical protein
VRQFLMKVLPCLLRPAAAAALMSFLPFPAPAQWLNYPTAGVPKKADGTPNLAAPTPKMADGKPDLSGLWGNYCPSGKGSVLCAPEFAVPQVFGDIGRGVKGGLPYQPWGGGHGEGAPGG